MPTTEKFIPEHNFLIIKLISPVTQDEWIAQIARIDRIETQVAKCLELADCRQTEFGTLGIEPIEESAKKKMATNKARLAILVNDWQLEIYGSALLYKWLVIGKYQEVEIFCSLKKAIKWLFGEDIDLAELTSIVENA